MGRFTPCFCDRKEMTEISIKKQSIKSLSDGISKFENSKNIVKNSDFSDFKQFLKIYLNTSEPNKRKKLAEEFKKRHLELYEFLKNNQELVSAETEISRTVNAVLSGDTANSDDKQLANMCLHLSASSSISSILSNVALFTPKYF